MKMNRMMLIAGLLLISVICIGYMNLNYDILARNTYVTKENHDLLIDKLNDEEIRYIVENNIDVGEFTPFLEMNNFEFENYRLYIKANNVRSATPYTVVSFVNAVVNQMDEETLLNALKYYDYALLKELVLQHSYYNSKADIVINPDSLTLKLGLNNTIGRYEPTDLILLNSYNDIMIANDDLRLRVEAADSLEAMCSYLADTFTTHCGGFVVSEAYMSYDTIRDNYAELLAEGGPNSAYDNYGYPSHNEHQLGLAFDLTRLDEEAFDNELAAIMNNAHKFGFVYYENENVDFKHLSSDLHFRYVGIENVKCFKNDSCTVEE